MFGFRFAKLRTKDLAGGRFKIKKFKKEIEPQEILLDSLAQKKEEEFGISGKRIETPLSKKLFRGFWVIFLIILFVFWGKTFQMQVLEGKIFSELSEENEFIIHFIQAERGIIYDKDLNQLVFNKPSFDLICEIRNLPQDEFKRNEVLKGVSRALQRDYEELKEEISDSQRPEVLVAENLSHQTLILLETKINDFPGFKIENNTVREYLSGPVFAHLIGYKRKTDEEIGLEKHYDDILKARPGELQIKRDARGNLISKEIVRLPESGQNLVLYLDSELQEELLKSLKKSIKNVGAESGAAVALDPKTGGILASVSWPSFDNNLFSQGMSEEQWQTISKNPNDPLFNRVISGRYLIGSTIKPLIASAVLEEKIIDPDKKLNCQGFITIPHQYEPEEETIKRDWMIHGWTDMRKAIAESCNVYFYTVGGGYGDQEGLGPTRIKEYLEFFGWGSKTGIDLPEEAEGFIPDKEWKKETWGADWWDGDTYNLSIGQGFLQITPLEVVSSFTAIANGGKLFQPQIVKEIIDSEKNLIEENKPKIIRENFIKPENLQIVREGMRQAVTRGSAANWLNSLPVSAAAKTGTAELGDNYCDNWITVFAPYEDPQIVLTVLVENVKSDRAAVLPVAKETLEWYFGRE